MEKSQNIWGIISLTCGILSLVTMCINITYLFNTIGIICGIVGMAVPNKKEVLQYQVSYVP